MITISVQSAGKEIGEEWQLLAVDVRHEVARIPSATLTFPGGEVAQGRFPNSDHGDFKLGAEIELLTREETMPRSRTKLFKGRVVRHRLEAGGGSCHLIVELKDSAVAMTDRRETHTYKNQTARAVVDTIVRRYSASIRPGEMDLPELKYAELTQYECSDWDFLQSLAESLGRWVVLQEGMLSVVSPPTRGAPKKSLHCGLDEIYDFEFSIDGQSICSQVVASAWNPKTLGIEAGRSKATRSGQGATDAESGFEALRLPPVRRRHSGTLPKAELEAWASGEYLRRRWSLLRGRVGLPFAGELRLLDLLELKRFGKRFEGSTPITGIAHRLDSASTRTDLQFGRSATPFAERHPVLEPVSAGLLPGVQGLQIGIVEAFEDDPEHANRVRLSLPLAGSNGIKILARWLMPDAGKNRGWFFFPEPGDEVLVGFINGDPRQAVILGSLYGPKNTFPSAFGPLDKKNLKKGFLSRQGIRFEFSDEDKPKLTLATPAGHQLLFDDQNKSVELVDANQNKITLNADGITLKTSKKFVIDAGGEVEIKGSKVDIK